ncbi:MAG TPA: mismatch-specific DNA-glycosylase [Stellaceae bacterium]|nr:mismatch-specific DNA-glycosylase [Stellaceae bacterium]
MRIDEDAAVLPDLLREGLQVVFVGINPPVFTAMPTHYFARPNNRFWGALSRSKLSRRAREALGVTALTPEHDRALLEHGFGFTDFVKRPTSNTALLSSEKLDVKIAELAAKLERHRPQIACFHGIIGYRRVHFRIARDQPDPRPGLQKARLGRTRLFLVPNTSASNSHVTLAQQTEWYDRLADALET